jgi:hypothetical protein
VNSDKHTRVCSTCGQGFTRNSSAIRHNNSLHSGHATILGPYDYIIGRLRGEFLPADPALYRLDHKNLRKSLGPGYQYRIDHNDNPFFDIHLDSSEQLWSPPDMLQPAERQSRPLYHRFGKPTSQLDQESFIGSYGSLERKSKLEELRVLLYKNYPPLVADRILAQNTYVVYQSNDDAFLESSLMFLRARFGNAY